MAVSHARVTPGRAASPRAETATVSVLFTDLVDSTGILSHDGADRSESMRRKHFGVLRDAVRRCRGEEIKTTGDGLMVVFRSALDAVDCSVAMQRGVARLRRDEPHSPEVRVGLSAGEATSENDDWYGQPVVEAARLCAAAASGQILLTDISAALIRTWTKHRIVDVGARTLKGFDEPMLVREVEWASTGVVSLPLPPAVSPVAHEVLVGREGEAERLLAAWERAKAGERRVVLIGGEPGIGKTSLTADLARRVHDDGGTVLWGRSDEDLDVPYQSFVEALQHFFTHAPSAEIVAQLGCRAVDLARLVPDLIEEPSPTPPVDPNGERLRLFEAVSTLLATAAHAAPVLLVLDDLHWASRSALKLVRHLARDHRAAAFLIVGTYRHTDIAPPHPLPELLADLHRERHVERVELCGLDPTDVAAYLEVASDGHVLDESGWEFASILHEETEGNPFFVGQLLRHLTETGVVAPREGQWRPDRPLDEYGLPDSVRDVIARRLARLSGAANRALKVAAVIGHEFELGTLELTPSAAAEPVTLLDALEESSAARLVVERDGAPGRFGFTHALVRQTLFDSLSVTRRSRLHREVGEAIEAQVVRDQSDVASRLAYHYCAGATAGTATRGVTFSEQAATEALEKSAYDAAIVHLERALKAFALAEQGDPTVRARLLVMLAEALHLSGEVTRSKEIAAQAAGEARFAGSAKLLARAAWWRAALPRAGAEDRPAAELLHEALRAIGRTDHRLRAALLGQLALYRAVNEGQGPAADPIAQEAVNEARVTGDPTAHARALMDRCTVLQGSPDVHRQERHCEELRALLPDVPARNQAAAAKMLMRHRVVVHLQTADIAGFDDDVRAFSGLGVGSRFSGDWLDLATIAMWRSLRATLEGRFGDAEEFASEMLARAPDEVNFHNSYAAQLFLLRRDQGRLPEIIDLLRAAADAAPRLVGFRAALALAHAELGNAPDAQQELDALTAGDVASAPYVTRVALVALMVETAAELDAVTGITGAYDLLQPYAGQLLVVGWGAACLGAADRFLGMAAAREGRWDEAERHFEVAVALESHVGAAPLLARTRLSCARMLAARGRQLDRARALRELDAVAAVVDGLDMSGLRRALALTRERIM
jgi:class 3 adenylate cyclase/tetratricopeptide (TPR) repeat protein